MINSINLPPGFSVKGVPCSSGGRECLRGCGGWNKKLDTTNLTAAFLSGKITVENAPCIGAAEVLAEAVIALATSK